LTHHDAVFVSERTKCVNSRNDEAMRIDLAPT
jgi:hypothetical protein